MTFVRRAADGFREAAKEAKNQSAINAFLVAKTIEYNIQRYITESRRTERKDCYSRQKSTMFKDSNPKVVDERMFLRSYPN